MYYAKSENYGRHATRVGLLHTPVKDEGSMQLGPPPSWGKTKFQTFYEYVPICGKIECLQKVIVTFYMKC